MKTPLTLSIAMGAVRAWTHLYTWRLPSAVRDARRAEIESDLWEAHADDTRTRDMPTPSSLRANAQILGRLILGVPDDLLWRAEHAMATAQRMTPRRIALTAVAAALVLAVLWVLPILMTDVLPPPPPSPRFVQRMPPPPPPPPPPPCPPPALGGCKP